MFGENLRKFRIKKDFTQKQLAQMIGVTSVTIQNYENNRREPNLETLTKLSLVLGVTVDELVKPNFNFNSKSNISEQELKKLVPIIEENHINEFRLKRLIDLENKLTKLNYFHDKDNKNEFFLVNNIVGFPIKEINSLANLLIVNSTNGAKREKSLCYKNKTELDNAFRELTERLFIIRYLKEHGINF